MGRHALGRAENGGWAWVELSGRVRVWFIWWWRSNLQPVALITHALTTSHLWPVSIGSYRCLSPRECKGKHALCAPQMSCNRGGVKGRELGKGRGQEVMSIYVIHVTLALNQPKERPLSARWSKRIRNHWEIRTLSFTLMKKIGLNKGKTLAVCWLGFPILAR